MAPEKKAGGLVLPKCRQRPHPKNFNGQRIKKLKKAMEVMKVPIAHRSDRSLGADGGLGYIVGATALQDPQ